MWDDLAMMQDLSFKPKRWSFQVDIIKIEFWKENRSARLKFWAYFKFILYSFAKLIN